MSGDPFRFLGSWWPWRSLGYLLTGPLVAVGSWVAAGLVIASSSALLGSRGVLALPLIASALVLVAIPLAAVERRRLRLMDPLPAPSPHRRPPQPGLVAWLRLRYREAATWREVAHALLSGLALSWLTAAVAVAALLTSVPLLLALVLYPWWPQERTLWVAGGLLVTNLWDALVATAIGAVLAVVSAYLLTAVAAGSAAITRALLAPREQELARQVSELEVSRARVVGAFDAERRRIERDLHDGAQQRLTSVIMMLGLARLELDGASPEARRLVAKAHEDAQETITELRELIRGIHPQVLTDRGLGAAVELLAERSTVPVTVDVDLPERPPEVVESAAYFVVSEALANVAKHAEARHAWVHARRLGDLLVMEVRDDGHGGADPAAGTGLAGLSDRVAVLDGRLTLDSPPGGPTSLNVELPCES
jgi:signal transduction histidine kinase